GNVHYGFQKEWLVPAFTTGGGTYVFGAQSLLDARGRAIGTKTLAELLEAGTKLSLKTMAPLDKPSAPVAGVNGKLAEQGPVAATSSWSSGWMAGAFTRCIRPPPRRFAPPPTSARRRPRVRSVRRSIRSTRSVLRSRPGQSAGPRWKAARRCWLAANVSAASG